jgi:hypothetical protein
MLMRIEEFPPTSISSVVIIIELKNINKIVNKIFTSVCKNKLKINEYINK